LLEEGKELMKEMKDSSALDAALIAAAQKVEHYEISGYGTARTLALQLNEREVARLLSSSLGEEESADFLLTEISKPILQEMLAGEFSTRKTGAAGARTQQQPSPKPRGGQKTRTA
jgi:ferritin-like metal-binding protein YciE